MTSVSRLSIRKEKMVNDKDQTCNLKRAGNLC